jgi:DNA-binding transcriptional ArsR family regulator
MNLEERALCFSVMGDPTRLAIIDLLTASEMSVKQLTSRLSAPQPTVSKHLRVLRFSGLLDYTKQGTVHTYHLNLDRIAELQALFPASLSEPVQRRSTS